MELIKRNMYAESELGGGASIDFDYGQVESALTSIETNISNIMDSLSERINVTSYSGSAQAEVESAVDSIRTYLATMKEPLNEMKNKINEVKEAYASKESGLKTALSGIGRNVQ